MVGDLEGKEVGKEVGFLVLGRPVGANVGLGVSCPVKTSKCKTFQLFKLRFHLKKSEELSTGMAFMTPLRSETTSS